VSEEHLVEACEKLVPGEQIEAAGVFQPRGTAGLMGALPGAAGVLGGWIEAEERDLPRYAIVAVTAREIVLFAAESFSIGWKPKELVGRFPRESTQVDVAPGVEVRKLTLRPEGGGAFELESPRIGPWHGKAVIAALRS
jgi:hypothetical protein